MNNELGIKNISLASAAGLIIVFSIFPNQTFVQAQAQQNQQLQVQGLAITPFLIETRVEAGKSREHKVTLTNTTDQPLPIEISINDFVPNNTTGQAKFLDVGEEANPAYSLSGWIKIVKQPSFTIPPQQQTEVIFTITPPLDAAPGTHYGGLLFSYRVQSSRGDTIVVTQKVGVLVLARLGQANEQGAITGLLAEHAGLGDNFRFLLTLYNSGNAHLKPKGEIYLTNLLGRQVASVPVNRDAQIVLPESQRIFESMWKPGWRLGRYTATAVLYFGNPKLEARDSIVVWIVPWQRVLLVLAIALALAYALRRLLSIYNRRIVSKAAERRKK